MSIIERIAAESRTRQVQAFAEAGYADPAAELARRESLVAALDKRHAEALEALEQLWESRKAAFEPACRRNGLIQRLQDGIEAGCEPTRIRPTLVSLSRAIIWTSSRYNIMRKPDVVRHVHGLLLRSGAGALDVDEIYRCGSYSAAAHGFSGGKCGTGTRAFTPKSGSRSYRFLRIDGMPFLLGAGRLYRFEGFDYTGEAGLQIDLYAETQRCAYNEARSALVISYEKERESLLTPG